MTLLSAFSIGVVTGLILGLHLTLRIGLKTGLTVGRELGLKARSTDALKSLYGVKR